MADEEGQKVLLYVYDLSQGFAAHVSQAVLGKHVSSASTFDTYDQPCQYRCS